MISPACFFSGPLRRSERMQPWYRLSGNFNCGNSTQCTSGKLQQSQYCETRSKGIDLGLSIAVEGVKITGTGVVALRLDKQRCTMNQVNDGCMWNDKLCHTVWIQQEMLKTTGYIIRQCDTHTTKKVVPRCMTNYRIDTPTPRVSTSCDFQCSDTNNCGHIDGTPCPNPLPRPPICQKNCPLEYGAEGNSIGQYVKPP